MIISCEPVEQICIHTGCNDIGKMKAESLVPFLAGIIMHFGAIVIEDGLSSAAVVKAMQNHLHPCSMQSLNRAENIDDPAIVNGVGHIVTYNMNRFIIQLPFEKSRDKIE